MKAAVLESIPGELEIQDIAIGEPGPREVLVRTVAAGLCHSDLHFMQGSLAGPMPTIPGHEPAGIVESVGPGVASVEPGDHVIACTSIFCGHCAQCLQGRPHLCTDRRASRRAKGDPPRISWEGRELKQFADLSGFSEYMLVHERAVV